MRIRITATIAFAALLLMLSASCNGGGGKRAFPPGTLPQSVAIQSLNISPSTVSTGTVVEITATYTNAVYFADMSKTWEATGGTLSESVPDFDLVLRGTAGIKSGSALLATTSSRVFWFTPAAPGEYTIKLTAGKATLSRSVVVTSAPLYLEVAPGAGSTTVVRIMARDVTDLYQGAFRIIFNANRFTPTEVKAGTLLGAPADILFLGLTNQSGFVPLGITRKGAVPGVRGSGTIAEVTFTNKTASLTTSSLAVAGFEMGIYLIRDSEGATIWGR